MRIGKGLTMSDRTESDADGQTQKTSRLYDAQGQVIYGGSSQVRSGTNRLETYIREQPISTTLIAFGIGYLLAKVFG